MLLFLNVCPFSSATKHTEAIYSNEPQTASPSVCSMVGPIMHPSTLECSSCSACVPYYPNLTTTLPESFPVPCYVRCYLLPHVASLSCSHCSKCTQQSTWDLCQNATSINTLLWLHKGSSLWTGTAPKEWNPKSLRWELNPNLKSSFPNYLS